MQASYVTCLYFAIALVAELSFHFHVAEYFSINLVLETLICISCDLGFGVESGTSSGDTEIPGAEN